MGCERRVIDWIKSRYPEREGVRVMDLGCGNGHFTLKLKEAGFDGLLGALDYCTSAVELAKQVLGEYSASVRVFQADILDSSTIPSEHHHQYDLVVDKGTFDAICLMGRPASELAVSFVKTLRLLTRPGALFIITSCNWTASELESIFRAEGLKAIHQIPHVQFKFGGQTGQDVSTVVFEL